jgi:hypothetical protein
MNRKKVLQFATNFCAIVVLTIALSSQCLANTTEYRPVIEVGAGVESTVMNDGINVLLKIKIGIQQIPGITGTDEPLGPEQLVWAHLSGDFAVARSNTDVGGYELPYMDIRFIPLHDQLAMSATNIVTLVTDLQAFPIEIHRDIRLDQGISVRASVVGFQLGRMDVQNERLLFFGQIAAEALGYKMVSHVSSLNTFHGMEVGTLQAEAGAAFLLGESFLVTLIFGGSADLSFSGNLGTNPTAQSDLRTYFTAKADLTEAFQLFIQAGLNANCEGQRGFCLTTPRILAGGNFLF